MTVGSSFPPLRVEQALRLLPDIDALAPLRAFLISSSRSRPPGSRTSDEHDRTVGKRYLQPADLRERIPQAIALVAEHLGLLYQAAVEALEQEQRGNMSGAVRALLRAGEQEENVGRYSQAHAWYLHAQSIAEELRDRRPEIAALRQVGNLEVARGQLEEGARAFQRCLAVAEAELDAPGAAFACQGLGDVAVAQGHWQGAEAWYTRGLRHGEADRHLIGHLTLGLAEVSRGRGLADVAADRLRQAKDIFRDLADHHGAVQALNEEGALAAAFARPADALQHYREALAQLHRAGDDPKVEMAIRLSLCRLHLETGRLPDAEDEARRAEELAIAHNFTHTLARLYVIMGKLRGRQGDENGFVFFEKALELCGGVEPSPRLEGEVYLEYALFRKNLGDREEARAYYQRAREIVELMGRPPALDQVETELAQLLA